MPLCVSLSVSLVASVSVRFSELVEPARASAPPRPPRGAPPRVGGAPRIGGLPRARMLGAPPPRGRDAGLAIGLALGLEPVPFVATLASGNAMVGGGSGAGGRGFGLAAGLGAGSAAAGGGMFAGERVGVIGEPRARPRARTPLNVKLSLGSRASTQSAGKVPNLPRNFPANIPSMSVVVVVTSTVSPTRIDNSDGSDAVKSCITRYGVSSSPGEADLIRREATGNKQIKHNNHISFDTERQQSRVEQSRARATLPYIMTQKVLRVRSGASH
jgi:hypothetical protein